MEHTWFGSYLCSPWSVQNKTTCDFVKRKNRGQRAKVIIHCRCLENSRTSDTGIHWSLNVLFVVSRFSADKNSWWKKLNFLSGAKALHTCPREICSLCIDELSVTGKWCNIKMIFSYHNYSGWQESASTQVEDKINSINSSHS
jgi:hypothetical protein